MKNVLFAFVLILLFSSCADTAPEVQSCLDPANAYGFWSGLWHGLIAPFSWIGSLFSDSIAVWAVNNNGAWYTTGFVFGIGALSSGSGVVIKLKN